MKRLACCFILLLLSSLSAAQYRATGKASYYAKKFEGRRTASGEVFSNAELTAAHPFLPFGTWVRVTHLASGRQVVVRINDRGPYVRNRIIDLSQAAADSLGIRHHGLAQVLVEEISPPQPATEPADVWMPAKRRFPEDWLGLWSGELVIYGSGNRQRTVPMQLRIDPDGAQRYRWNLVYGGDERSYVLLMDSSGRCAIDEQNGILLKGRCSGEEAHFRFAVEGSLLDCSYSLLNDSTLLFRIGSGGTDPSWSTGGVVADGGSVPVVMVYDLTALQRALLYRRSKP